jgi:hypothetical protein
VSAEQRACRFTEASLLCASRSGLINATSHRRQHCTSHAPDLANHELNKPYHYWSHRRPRNLHSAPTILSRTYLEEVSQRYGGERRQIALITSPGVLSPHHDQEASVESPVAGAHHRTSFKFRTVPQASAITAKVVPAHRL